MCYGEDGMVGNAPQVEKRPTQSPDAMEALNKNNVTFAKTTDIFIPQFTLYREYRTINLKHVAYKYIKISQNVQNQV